jgi:threonylcarbamoyladenosine tRNA methylthiotransferase MtaB
MKNVALHNLGCKVNSYEMDVMQQMLQENGYKIVPFDQMADIYIINTCSVTNIADRKSRQMLHRAKKQNPKAIVVALGCYVQTAAEQIEKDECIDLAIGNNKKKDLIPILEEFLRCQNNPEKLSKNASEHKSDDTVKTLGGRTIIDINHTGEYEEMMLEQTAEHTRAYIKIQDGCNQFCSYCIIPFARGRVRSRAEEDITAEIRGLCEKGYQEFVLTGIHISSYGLDFKGEAYNATDIRGEELLKLICQIAQIDGVKRLRLGSLEPCIITEEFAKSMSEIPQLCPHFHLSLQSGCDATLRRMNRQYTTAEFEKGVRTLRKYFDRPAITTDIITGFPGETEEEFALTKEFLERIQFFELHVFPYSKRQGTVAANMEGQLTESVKKERSRVLLELEKKQSKAYRESFLGQEEEVLLEEEKEIEGKLYMTGHTKRYVKVCVLQRTANPFVSNQIVSGKMVAALGQEMMLFE